MYLKTEELEPIRESQNTQPLEVRFRALLAECGAKFHYHREGFDRFGKALV